MNQDIDEEYKIFKKKEENKNHRFKKHILNVVDKPVKRKGYELFYYFENPELNIWKNIRNDVLEYFKNKWWKIDEKDKINYEGLSEKELSTDFPTGNMLSSQISCVNHLFFLRKNKYFVSTVLQKIDPRIIDVEIVDDGYIGFEKMGGKKDNNPLKEKSPNRKEGSKSTSIDALMVGKKQGGKNILVLIEWKYTEKYENQECKYRSENDYHKNYIDLLQDKYCPIKIPENIMDLFFDPYYQLMRQTLLGHEMVKLNEYDCDEYINLHIIPYGNTKLRNNITTPINWKYQLNDPQKYIVLSPEELLQPLYKKEGTNDLFDYLYKRYIEKYG
jgi:hypothetical protein